jgi:lysozyme
MFAKNHFLKSSFRYLAILVLCSTFSISEPLVARANQKIEQGNTNNLNYALNQDKITAANFQVLPATLNLIKQHEGFRSYAYIDSNGLPVIGYGQSIINGQTVTIGQYITQAEADAALAIELERIHRLVLNTIQVDLNAHQLGALTSLVYNAGTRVITQSTLSRKLNLGDFAGAAQEFPRWNKANQGGLLVVFPGLTKRRLDEQKLFLTPTN